MRAFVNGKIVLSDEIREDLCIMTENGRIAGIAAQPPEDMDCVDLHGLYLSPGFVDIHCHGGGGHDFMDNTLEAMQGALRCHMAHGTTTLVPTATSGDVAELRELGQIVTRFAQSGQAARLPFVPGLHFEGPYISVAMRGAQDERYIKTPQELAPAQLLDALGYAPLIWTVAPELPGVNELCRQLRGQGVYFSLGHSDAIYDEVVKGVEAGFTMVTHLYSGMSTIRRENGYRIPGVLESALLLEELAVEVIADGSHIPVPLLRLVVKDKGVDNIILITDAMRGAGMPPGTYKLGSLQRGQDVLVGDDVAHMPDGINFAGSIATADRLLRTMVGQAGVPLWDAVAMLTRNPARSIGLDHRKGSLKPGMDADFAVFDEQFDIHHVFIGGEQCI